MIATSVAARGLDIKEIRLVINYKCPNHMEDYVHRIGRTGRAGNEGTAYTLISPEEEHYAEELITALKTSNKEIPPELLELDRQYKLKIEKGELKKRFVPSGYQGRGYDHFSQQELKKDQDRKKNLALGYIEDEIDLQKKKIEEEMSDAILAEILRDPKAKHIAKEAVADIAKDIAL